MNKNQTHIRQELPEKWDSPIPPRFSGTKYCSIDGSLFQMPSLSQDWLDGLEEFIRRVVREEVKNG